MWSIEIFALLIAVYGALLSSILALREFTKDRRRIKVSCNIAGRQIASGPPELFVIIEVTNVGHRPLTINGGGFILSNGSSYNDWLSPPSDKLPKTMGDGEALKLLFDYQKIKQYAEFFGNKQIRFTNAYVLDSEGKVYKAKLPPDEEAFGRIA